MPLLMLMLETFTSPVVLRSGGRLLLPNLLRPIEVILQYRGLPARHPVADCFLVTLHRPPRRPLSAPAQLAQDAPHIVLVVSHPGVRIIGTPRSHSLNYGVVRRRQMLALINRSFWIFRRGHDRWVDAIKG
jgi:hypothetical protein